MVLIYKSLKVDIPFEALSIEDIKITISLNDHASLYIKLLTAEGKIQEYVNRNIENEKVTVYKENGQKLFVGKLKKFEMSFEGGVEAMEIYCTSYTKDFDIKKNSRAFYNLTLPYSSLINKVLESYPKKGFIDNATGGALIGNFVLQYEETDWEFIKRMATRFNAVLLPDVTVEYGRFYFGIHSIGSGRVINSDEYEIFKDIDQYKKKESLGIEDNFLQEYTKWDIVYEGDLNLGEKVTFNNVCCIVSKIRIEKYKEEIKNVYTLSLERGVRTTYKTNHKIFGMSLPATVKEVQGNTMKVTFNDVENNGGGSEKYFTFAIESSSWYCMPESGSEVHIYMPTNDEKDAIAVHAIRKTGDGAKYASKTQDPSVKSFSHTAGSEMKLTPGEMNFSSDAGGASSINLSQSGEVNLSASSVSLNAASDVILSGGIVDISAKENVTISRSGSKIELSDNLNLGGTKVDFDGSQKDAVDMPSAVTEWQNADMSAQIDEINAGAEQFEIQKIEEAKSKVSGGIFCAVMGAVALGAAAVALAGATVLTGGLALGVAAAVVCGTAGVAFGASQVSEGMSDYSKVQGGDFSKSYNPVRDGLLGGNQALYDGLKFTLTIANGLIAGFLTGGATWQAAAEAGMGALKGSGLAVVQTAISDYLDDGQINFGPEAYRDAIMMGGSLGGFFGGANANKPKVKLKDRMKNTVKNTKDIIKNAKNSIKNGAKKVGNSIKNGAHNLKNSAKNAGNKFKNICLKAKDKIGDPIDAVDGSLYIPAVDIQLPDINNEFKVERKYESTNYETGIFGYGWTSNIECYLKEDDVVTVLCSDGHVEIFNFEDGEYINTKNNSRLYTLKKENNNWLFKSYDEDKTYKFDESGKLINVVNIYGNTFEFTYIGDNIETITTFSNYKLFFTYKDNKVIQIKDELGRCVQYKYDGDFLTQVVHVDQGVTRYNYDDQGYISSVTDQNGQTYIKNTFDEKGRVIRQEYPDGGYLEISYDDSEKENTSYYHSSGRTEKVKYNETGLITHFIYDDGTFEEYGYDEYQNRNFEKDRNDNITRREFNIFGSLVKEELPNGLIKEFEYDENQNLIKSIDN